MILTSSYYQCLNLKGPAIIGENVTAAQHAYCNCGKLSPNAQFFSSKVPSVYNCFAEHAKEVVNVIKLQIEAGKATPAPPVGPALGSSGVNIMQFVKEFNDRTANQPGMIIPVVITVYKDKTFTFITKVPPVAVLIKKALKIQKGSGKPNRDKVATITKEQVREIAEQKMEDLNAASIETAMSMVMGTARSMGVIVAE